MTICRAASWPWHIKTNFTVVCLLALHSGLLAFAAARNSPVWDEGPHLVAGISHWQHQRFDLYRVNPPLVRLIATIPVVLAHPVTDWHRYDASPGARSESAVYTSFVASNGEQIFWFHTLARWMCIPISILGGYVAFRWARELYGAAAGILALTLWCFSPTVLAYGASIVPDLGATSLGLVAMYSFWKWLRVPTCGNAVRSGLLLGLAELTKSTWIVLFAVYPMIWCCWRLFKRVPLKSSVAEPAPDRCYSNLRYRIQDISQLGLILFLGVLSINLGYGFENSFQKLEHFNFVSDTLGESSQGVITRPPALHNRFVGTFLGGLRVPLPGNYIMGLDIQKSDFEQNPWCFLRGEWRRGGWLHYYLYALLVKEPLGTCILGVLALATLLTGRYSAAWRDELTLLAAPIVVFIMVSSQTGVNHHIRYVLPCFPFVFIWLGKLATSFELKHRIIAGMTTMALAWSFTSSLAIYPHNMSYFNELVGGPRGGHWHLSHSNTDWGQDLLYLKRWYEHHPEAKPLHLAYYMELIDPTIAGIQWCPVPRGPVKKRTSLVNMFENCALEPGHKRDQSAGLVPLDTDQLGPFPGWFVLSVNQIHRLKGDYEYFLQFKPVDHIGYSMNVYHITFDQANEVRRKIGLRSLVDSTISSAQDQSVAVK